MINKRSIFFLVIFIAVCFKFNSQTKHHVDSLSGFDSTAVKQYSTQHNLNSLEQALYSSKKKREYKNIKFNLFPSLNTQAARPINSNNAIMSGNLDFEAGNLSGWGIATSANLNSVTMQTCCTNPTLLTTAVNGGTDPHFGFSLTSPLGGNYVARLNSVTNLGFSVTTISNTIPVTASTNFLKIAGKYVFEMASHSCNDQPYVNIKVTDLSGTTIIFSKFIQANELVNSGFCSGSNLTGQQYATIGTQIFYTNYAWDISCIDLSALIGQSAKVEITVAECAQGGHGGYAYFDLLNTGFTPVNNTININNTSYSVTSQPFNLGICNSNTAIATAPAAALSYTWFGNGINGLTTQSVQINQAGNYTLVSTMPSNSGCSNLTNNSVVQFTVGISNTITASSNTLVCGSAAANFTLFGANNYSISSTYGYNNIISGYNISITPPVTCTFYVTGLNTLGCSATKTINIQVSPQPTLSISGNNFCSGNSGTIAASGADTYVWTQGSVTLSTTNQLILTPTASAAYYLTGTNTLTGCSNGLPVNTAVFSNSLTVSPVPLICYGNSITLSANGSAYNTYTWSTGSNFNSITLNPTVTTTYTLLSNNVCGNVSTPFTLTVVPLPNLVISGPSSVCANSTYTWTTTGGNINYVFSGLSYYAGIYPTLVANVNSNSTPYINLTGTDSYGCQSSTSYSFIILPVPSVSMSSSNNFVICPGNTITLNAAGANSYTWNTGSNSNNIVVSPTVTTCYSFTGTAANGCAASVNNCVSVNNSPTVTPLATTYTTCNGNSINIGQNLSQCCNITYSINNQYIYNPNFFIPIASGTHTLSVDNGCSVVQATFNVNVLPTPTVTILAPDSACKNSVVTITLSGADNYNYYVNSGSYITTNSINSFPLYYSQTIQAFGSYTNGCSSAVPSPTYFIKALDPPSMTITPASNTVCAGSMISLSVSLSAASFSWSTGSTVNTITLTPISNTIISVTSTGTNGCSSSISKTITAISLPTLTAFASPTAICIGSTSNLYCNGANSYTWSNSFVGSAQTVTPTISTMYSVTGYSTNNPCPATQTVNIIVNPLPPVNFLQTQYSVCANGTAVITATGATNYYYPYPGAGAGSLTIVNPASTNTYIVTGTDGNGCSKNAITTLSVLPFPTISVISATSCSGNYATLTANGANSYTWSNGAFTNTNSVNPPTTTIYTVTGANIYGCTGTQIGQVVVSPSPSLSVSIYPASVCIGGSGYLSVTGANTYTWSNNSNSGSFYIYPLANSIFTVSGTSGNCTSTNTLAIAVNALPLVNAITNNSIICNGQQATITASGANTYTWNTSSTNTTIVVSPTINTTYTVNGIDANGCENFAIITQSVSLCTGMAELRNETQFIRISPNPSSGLFYIDCNLVSENRNVYIYNALGQLLFKQQINSVNATVDLNNYANGLYYLEVSENEVKTMFKVIKQ